MNCFDFGLIHCNYMQELILTSDREIMKDRDFLVF